MYLHNFKYGSFEGFGEFANAGGMAGGMAGGTAGGLVFFLVV